MLPTSTQPTTQFNTELRELITGLVWTTVFVAVWGVEMLVVPMTAFLVVLVLSIATLVGGPAGIPLMFARHQLNEG